MSQSPLNSASAKSDEDELKNYLRNWTDLATRIRRGQSFSGRERNCVFLNTSGTNTSETDSDERWATISGVSGLDKVDDARAVAATDWDHDGDLDLWVANRTGPRVRFFQNKTGGTPNFLQLRLSDALGNRDAIGAKVEVHLRGAKPLTRTAQAGRGFVSQSSKWLHFGLGDSTLGDSAEIERILVRWPDGKEQAVSGLQPGGRYLLSRSRSGAVAAAPAPRRKVAANLQPTRLPSQPSNEKARIVLTRRPSMELPQLANGKPTLLLLAASWCPNCREELAELEKHADTLNSTGLDVVIARVDAFASNDAKEASKALAEPINSVFRMLDADASMLHELSEAEMKILYFERPMLLPTSYLLDADDRLAMIYKGRLSTDALLADAQRVAKSSEKVSLSDAFPFEGRSALGLFPLDAVSTARAYEEAGYDDVAEQELIRYLVETSRSLSQGMRPTPKIKREVENAYVALAVFLRERNRTEESRAIAMRGLRYFPRNTELKQLSEN